MPLGQFLTNGYAFVYSTGIYIMKKQEIEIWKQITIFEHYQISSFGKTKSLSRYVERGYGRLRMVKEKILKQGLRSGYPSFVINVNGKSKSFLVHRLVAEAFIPNPENKPQVNHKDGNKQNNHFSNLEWATSKENIRHSMRIGLTKNQNGEGNNSVKLTEKEVLEIREKYFQKEADRQELSKQYKVSISTIRNIILRIKWNHI